METLEGFKTGSTQIMNHDAVIGFLLYHIFFISVIIWSKFSKFGSSKPVLHIAFATVLIALSRCWYLIVLLIVY